MSSCPFPELEIEQPFPDIGGTQDAAFRLCRELSDIFGKVTIKSVVEQAPGTRGKAPLTEAELDFRDLQRNPERRREWRRHCEETLARWVAEHPEAPKPERKTRQGKKNKPARYTKRWTIVDE